MLEFRKKIQCHVNIISPPNWESSNITTITISDLVAKGKFRLHKSVAPQFESFFKAAAVKGLASRVLTNDGSYFSRTITGNPAKLSNHALGTAIDINAKWNPYGSSPARRGKEGSVSELADFCADFGIYWGGWYKGNKDGMHFECVSILDEATLRAACRSHGVDFDTLDFFSPPGFSAVTQEPPILSQLGPPSSKIKPTY